MVHNHGVEPSMLAREDLIVLGVLVAICLFGVAVVVWRIRLARRRKRAMRAVAQRYGLKPANPVMAALGFSLPRLHGQVQGHGVQVFFWSNRRFDATTFHINVLAPTFGMAVVEARKEIGKKGFIGSMVERNYVGDQAVPIHDPHVSKTFSVRGQDAAGLAHALSHPSVVPHLMSLHRDVSSVGIEWGLIKFHVDEILTDPDRIAALIDRGVLLAQWLDGVVAPAHPPGPR
jgi:hypothetical protein